MQNLSVREFKQKCECIAPKQYIFASINQSWNRVEDPMKLEMSFQIMLIAYNPNAICFKNSSGLMCLERVTDINSTFKHQDDLQSQFTGGTVIHCYLEGAIPGEHAKQIVKSMFETYRVPYMSLSPISRYCPDHGYIDATVDKCPVCKKRLKLFQRITGYLRCVDNFNRGKAAEFKDRNQL